MTISAVSSRQTSAPQDTQASYTIQRGDTLSAIAKQHGVSLSALLAANPQVRNPDVIYPGEHLDIPHGSSGNGGTSHASTASTSSATAAATGGKFDYNRIAGVRGNPNVTPAFIQGVEAMAARLGTKPEYLLAVMSFETGGSFSPGQKNNAGSGATGLIQFMPGTASGLGTSTSALARMSSVDQLQYVEKYFMQRAGAHNGKLGTLEGVYTTVLYGSPKSDPNSTLWSSGSSAYSWNKGLDKNHDGRITAGEAANAVRGRVTGNIDQGGSAPPSKPAPPGNNPSPPSNSGGSYTVHSGDTMSGIAARNGVSLSALMAANPQVHNADLIYPGQTLHLPGSGGSSAGRSHDYTVHSGDSLSAIAARNGVSLDSLLSANPQVHNPNLIYAGQTIHIPGGSGGGSPPPASTTHNYTVHSGDTMSGIAARNGISLASLEHANPQISNFNRISIGQVIHIPGAGSGPVEGPGPSGPVKGTDAAANAKKYLGRYESDLQNAGVTLRVDTSESCANFVTAMLKQSGKLPSNFSFVQRVNVHSMSTGLQSHGWHKVSLANAKPGDVWVCDGAHGESHTEIVASNDGHGHITLIGSNNHPVRSNQQINYDTYSASISGSYILAPP